MEVNLLKCNAFLSTFSLQNTAFIQNSNLTDTLMKTFVALWKKITLSISIINGEPKFSKLQFVEIVYNTTRLSNLLETISIG